MWPRFLVVVIGVAVARFMWKAYVHPAHVLGRQAAHMNWVASGTARDAAGYRNTRFSRGPNEAVVSYQGANVLLVKPAHPQPFEDFVEIETWLATRGPSSEAEGQVEYYQSIEKYITSLGWYDRLLTLQGTDPQYCDATLRVYRAGFLAGESEKVVGALIMESVNKYSLDRSFSMAFLKALEEQFLASPPSK